MNLYNDLLDKKEKLSIMGLGYVGLVLGIAFAKKVNVIGFDINVKKINKYINGIDSTNEVGSAALKSTTMAFTSDERDLKKAKFHIIAVPTPINSDKTPDLSLVINATQTLGRYLSQGSVIVYESTVFPGVTENICIPILEKESGLICGIDFKVGYSPERVNPGDKMHTVDKIIKVVSGMDEECLDIIASVYELVIKAGVYKASSIQIAEAAKVIENAQRDINIAFINELALIFNKMDIDTHEVIAAASTKWNFLPFYPGLVGGHCISVDPYYLIDKSEKLGYTPLIMSASRKINEHMGKYVAEQSIKLLLKTGRSIKDANVAILGITFKENCPDIRNTKVIDIINRLKQKGVNCFVVDPLAEPSEIKEEYAVDLIAMEALNEIDIILIAVAHDTFKKLSLEALKQYYHKNPSSSSSIPILVDVKGLFNKEQAKDLGYLYWRL